MLSVVVGLGKKAKTERGSRKGVLRTSCQEEATWRGKQAGPRQTTGKSGSRTPGGPMSYPTTYLEEGEAHIVLEDDTAYAPHVTGL